jgi:hypothetical protein
MDKSPTDRPTTAAQPPTERPASTRSRLTNGSELLPGTDARSTWARLFKDVTLSLEAHCGGELSETERMTARRAAALEVELCHLEADFAQQRAAGKAPDAATLDLYSRLAGGQRRHLEALGMQRKAKEVLPTLGEYLKGKSA